MRVEGDGRFALLREALSASPGREHDGPGADGDRIDAAVSVVIRARESLDFLLIKRATSERDPWWGQMALPGGRWDRSDSGLLHTAQRETREETGVDLERVGSILGRLDDVAPSNPLLPKMRIAAFVFWVPENTEAIVASAEVQSVYWVPLDTLRAPDTRTSLQISSPHGTRAFPSYQVSGEHVWGLTHRILTHFLTLYPES